MTRQALSEARCLGCGECRTWNLRTYADYLRLDHDSGMADR